MKRVSLIFLASLVLISGPSFALDPLKTISQYRHDVWQTDQGLPQNSVNAILQTRDGYLWLGTYQGLVRFDGQRFMVFRTESTPELRSNRILALCEDRDGTLWIGTSAGGLTRYRDGAFTTYSTREGLANDSVLALHVDRSGALWIGTRGGGLARFDHERFTTFGAAQGLTSDIITSVAEGPDGSLWFGTDGEGLVHYRDGKFSTLTTADGLLDNEVWSVYVDRRGDLWIGTYGEGVARLHDGTFTNFRVADGLPNGRVFAITEDRDDNLWFGTDGGGIARFRDGRFTTYASRQGLSADSVYSIYEDREGSLWVGTFTGGLNRLTDGAFTSITAEEGFTDDFVYSIFQDHDGVLWFGSASGRVFRSESGGFREAVRGPKVSIWSMAEDGDGQLWVGTDGDGLARVADRKLITYSVKDGLANDVVWSLIKARDGGLWIGTAGGGLNRFKDGKFQTFGKDEGLSNLFIRVVHEDRQGRVWVGTDGGGLASLEHGRFTTYTTRDGLSNDSIRAIYEDQDGVLWIGTYGGGVTRFEGGRFTALTSRHGLFDDVVFQILEDGTGNLWMSCNRGVFKVSRRELNEVARGTRKTVTSLAYGTRDGMKSAECSDGSPAAWRARDGRLWFATSRGVTVVDPDRIRVNRQPPPVVIERVTIDNQAVTPGMSIGPQLGKGRFEFQYVGLSLVAPERMRFRYRLDGFDENWIEAGTRHTAYYTNLPPGAYRFVVMAANNDGVWNEAGASFEFHRAPRFSQTYWFYAICGVAAASVGTGGHLWRVRRARKREAELMQLVEERTIQLAAANKKLEAANEKLEGLSYRDGLTGVSNRRHFDEEFDREWRRAYRARLPLSIIMIDLDRFKAFNDMFGHPSGDQCLRSVATALAQGVSRVGDVVARYGGEEFVMLLQGAHKDGAALVAERVRVAVASLGIAHPKAPSGSVVTISLGVTTVIPTNDFPKESILAAADRALYQAKRMGGNRWDVADPIPAPHQEAGMESVSSS